MEPISKRRTGAWLHLVVYVGTAAKWSLPDRLRQLVAGLLRLRKGIISSVLGAEVKRSKAG